MVFVCVIVFVLFVTFLRAASLFLVLFFAMACYEYSMVQYFKPHAGYSVPRGRTESFGIMNESHIG